MIRWATGNQWSHTFVVGDIIGNRKNKEHRTYILDATYNEPCSYTTGASYDKNELVSYEIWQWKRSKPEEIDAALRALEEKYLKEWFTGRTLLAILVYKVTGIPSPFRNNIYCSGMVFDYLQYLQIAFLPKKVRSYNVTPGDLYEFVTSRTDIFEKIGEKK